MSSTIRRAGTSLAAAATLVLVTVGGALAQPTTTTDDPAQAAAGWLTTQLTDGDHVYYDEFAFADAGLTADVLFALSGVGVASGTIHAIADWLESQAGAYGGPGGTAKLILAADIAGRDVDAFGGQDLVENLLEMEIREDDDPNGPIGRYHGTEWDTPLVQSLALLALARVDVAPSDEAIDLLLAQQCTDGGFSESFLGDEEVCSDGGVDTTAFAVDALYALGETEAADAAVAWLATTQQADGSFIGDGGPSSNSTGLGALALRLGGEDSAADAARDWVLDQQAACGTDTPGAILADPDGAGETLRATPQALLGVVGQSLTAISAEGASSDVPLLDCPEPRVRDLTVSCDAEGGEVTPGDRISCVVAGLDADEVVHVLVTLNPTLLDEDITADGDGVAPFAFDVPGEAGEGDTISIRIDAEGDAAMASLTLTVGSPGDLAEEPIEEPVEVADTDPVEGTEAADGELPRTGTATPPLVGLALALLLIGWLLLAPTRGRGEAA